MSPHDDRLVALEQVPIARPRSEAGTAEGHGSGRRGSDRRQFLQRAMAAGVGFGLASLGVLPPARRAVAQHPKHPYTIKDGCPSDDPNRACRGCGPSSVRYEACVKGENTKHRGFHRKRGRRWRLRPNRCQPGARWDGWKWKVGGPCFGGFCSDGITFRCHDGKQCNDRGKQCDKTICRWVLRCQ